ncbi:MAG: CHASE2 domain-containing protein [Cyanobacteria bacterium P01_A01_bin.83]
MAVVLPITVLVLSQVCQPLELAIYDFDFLIRPTELTDERLVIVEWDEKSIQMLEETTISDNTLFTLLSKIEQQQPRIIGLDLYRDIPVLSPRLSDEQNLEAYASLNQFFSLTENLIGIEKVVEPTINAPLILKQKEQIAASDIATDRDDTVRRAYIFPQVDESGAPAGIPYLGVALGYQYLELEGWQADQLEDYSLKIAKGESSITVKPLTAFNSDPYGLDTLINWRKGNPSFRRVSVTEVVSNQIPPDLFHDQIVLIGNVSASTADRHNLPLDRASGRWSYGVQIPAQVASSIVSAAIDQRPLLKAASKPVELGLVLISAFSIIVIISKYQNFELKNLYLTTFVYAFGLTSLLLLLNLIGFTRGWWIPVVTAIAAIWIVYFFTNYYIYQERSRKNVLKLEMFVRDLQHSLGNPLNSIASSNNRIQISTQEIKNSIVKDDDSHSIFERNTERESSQSRYTEDLVRTTLKPKDPIQHLTIIQKRAVNIEKQVLRMERYRKRTEDFINFGYLNKTNALELTAINQFVAAIVARFQSENEYDYQIDIYQDYDIRIKEVEIDSTAMEIVLENLLDNAAYAVAPRESSKAEHNPLIRVQTKQNKKTIELRVEDNGVGIPTALHQKIFQPFVSFNYRQGIGLYLTKRILSLYRGNIKVESKEGQGCRFIVTMPLIHRTLLR